MRPSPPYFQFTTITSSGTVQLIAEAICQPVPLRVQKKFPQFASGEYWYLHRLWVRKSERRKGYAGHMLGWITELADKQGLGLVLRCYPFEPSSPSRRTLSEFYRSAGFVPVRGSPDLFVRRTQLCHLLW